MKEDTHPEVDSPVALGKLELLPRAPCILLRMRQYRGFFGRVSRIFSVTVNSNPEVDAHSWSAMGACECDKVFTWRWRQVAFSRERAHHTGDELM